MATGIIKATQSSQVALALEKKIGSGLFAPGRKMPSTRELARQFDVSQQVIKSALTVLERRSLILREPRIGIYVNPAIASQQREFSLLALRRNDLEIADYASTMLSIGEPDLWEEVNLSTRYVSEAKLSETLVRYELEKISDARPDVLLTSLYLPEADRRYRDLPFPVIFLGDIIEDADPVPEPLCQIVEDTGERAAFMIRTAAAAGCREIALISGGDPEHSWGKLLRKGGEKAAAELGVGFRYVRHLAGCHDATVGALLKGRRPDGVAIDGFRNIDSFVRKMSEVGLYPGDNVKLVADGEMYPGALYVRVDYRDFSRAVIELVNRLIDRSDAPTGRLVLSGLIRRQILQLK